MLRFEKNATTTKRNFWGEAAQNIKNIGHLECSPTGLSSSPPELWPGQSFALVSISHWFPIGLTDASNRAKGDNSKKGYAGRA